ncbi:hypothetical protein ACJA25_01155 [Mycoplasmopsis hyopharyngis]|uniref:hypothetical protein n=1 Tax=Mycoplasmopsis hyopharyngis TaxID=29558 RepID=UPI00387386BE
MRKQLTKILAFSMCFTMPTFFISVACSRDKNKNKELLLKRDELLKQCNDLKINNKELIYKNINQKVSNVIIKLNNLLETKYDILKGNLDKIQQEILDLKKEYASFKKEVASEILRLETEIETVDIFYKDEENKNNVDISQLKNEDFLLKDQTKDYKLHITNMSADNYGIVTLTFKLESTLDKFKNLSILSNKSENKIISGFLNRLENEKVKTLNSLKSSIELQINELKNKLPEENKESFENNKDKLLKVQIDFMSYLYNLNFSILSKEIKELNTIVNLNKIFLKLFNKSGIEIFHQIIIDHLKGELDFTKISSFTQNEILNKYLKIIQKQVNEQNFKDDLIDTILEIDLVKNIETIAKKISIFIDDNKKKQLEKILKDRNEISKIANDFIVNFARIELKNEDNSIEKIKEKVFNIFKNSFDNLKNTFKSIFSEEDSQAIINELTNSFLVYKDKIKSNFDAFKAFEALSEINKMLKKS